MKNILLCNDALGIGGVETVICNQVMAFSSKGYNVYVLAGKGIYSERIKEFGGKHIEMDFPETNKIDTKKIQEIVNVIEKYNITEIHIHKYQCIPYVMPAALIKKVPYIAYEHMIKSSIPYYTWNYPIYNSLFEIYFKNAYKILAITPKTIENTKEKFDLERDKYIIMHNGINFDVYTPNKRHNGEDYHKWLIISVFREEKTKSIKNGIDLFAKYIEEIDTEATLDIIGGGTEQKEIEKYIKKQKLENKISILGQKNNVEEYIGKYDVVLGLDRCILETIAMKVPAVILGYEELKGPVTDKNFDLAMEENFSGNNMPTITKEKCIDEIKDVLANKEAITEKVYTLAKEKLDANKIYYTIQNDEYPENVDFDWINLFKIIERYITENTQLSKENKDKWDYIQIADKKIVDISKELKQEKYEKEEIMKKYKNKEEEIKQIYNSKRWRCFEKLDKLLGRKNSVKLDNKD